VRLVPFDDPSAPEAAIRDETIAIMVEPIQGEGGVVTPRTDYLRALRDLCDRRQLLLILDEIQVGLGRTGKLFAYEHAGIVPDVMSLAKALGGGIPIGAMLTTQDIADVMTPGSHGTTFGGNPVACAAAVAAVRAMAEPALLANVEERGAQLRRGLEALATRHACIKEVRGLGLILGAVLDRPGQPVVERCREAGLLINCTADRVLRFLPPLVVTAAEVDEALGVVDRALVAVAS
jgi:acetylornithine/succinyldiaminopimelate/putrescine aminotransferase